MRTLIALALTGCGAAQRPIPAGQQKVAAIELLPVDRTKITASTRELVGGLALERARVVGDPFDRYLLATDKDRLKAWYMRHGFFRAQIQGDVADQGKDAVKVTFRIDEGPRARLAKVVITGLPNDPVADAAKVRKLIALADGASFDYDTFDASKPAIDALLAKWGYRRATSR